VREKGGMICRLNKNRKNTCRKKVVKKNENEANKGRLDRER
jgi:hypothetical protein